MNRFGNNVYSTMFLVNALPNAITFHTSRIDFANQNVKLKSLSIDIIYLFNALQLVEPVANSQTQWFQMQIGDAVQRITKFSVPVAPYIFQTNGQYIDLFSCGQYFFENFFIQNTITFAYNAGNRDLINTCTHTVRLITEIEILSESNN